MAGLDWYKDDSGEVHPCHGQGSYSRDNHLPAFLDVALLGSHHEQFEPRIEQNVGALRVPESAHLGTEASYC